MYKLNVLLLVAVAVNLCDSHGHFSHQSIISTGLSGLFGSVNKVHEVASAVVGSLPGLNVNFESNVQYGGGGNYRPQYPNYNQPQKKPDEVVILIVDEGSGGHKGPGSEQHHLTDPQQYPQHPPPPPHHGNNPSQQWQGGPGHNPGNNHNYQGGPQYYPGNNQNNQGGPQYYPGNNQNNQGAPQHYPVNNQNNQGGPQYNPGNNQNNQGYRPNQNYAPNNNYQGQVNFPPNHHKPNFHSNYQPNPNNNQQEDCGQNQEPNAGRPKPGYGGGGGYNQYPNFDNNKPSVTTPKAQPTLAPAPATTPKWHDNENAQTFPTASPAEPTDADTSHHSGQGPDNQGYQKPVDHDNEKNEVVTATKPVADEPLLVPLNPNEYVYGGDKIMINAPKRETQKEATTKAPVKEEEEVFPIDIRFGD